MISSFSVCIHSKYVCRVVNSQMCLCFVCSCCLLFIWCVDFTFRVYNSIVKSKILLWCYEFPFSDWFDLSFSLKLNNGKAVFLDWFYSPLHCFTRTPEYLNVLAHIILLLAFRFQSSLSYLGVCVCVCCFPLFILYCSELFLCFKTI